MSDETPEVSISLKSREESFRALLNKLATEPIEGLDSFWPGRWMRRTSLLCTRIWTERVHRQAVFKGTALLYINTLVYKNCILVLSLRLVICILKDLWSGGRFVALFLRAARLCLIEASYTVISSDSMLFTNYKNGALWYCHSRFRVI